MINFYKQDEIGKAAFADGSIYTPQGNVSLLLDATTKQIVIAEDEKIIYWISTSEELQVDGEAITGTDAEKLALIAPIFQGAAGGNTEGGTGGRFGIEDNTSSVNRTVDMASHGLTIGNIGNLDMQTGDFDGSYSELYADGGSMLLTSNSGVSDYSKIRIDKTVGGYLNSSIGLKQSEIGIDENGAYITQVTRDATQNPDLSQKNRFIFPNTAEANGIEKTETVAYLPTQQFANNADAVAALGVGKLYKSTTKINESPIILITE